MPIRYELVTPERLVREGTAYMVTVPGVEGDFGVLEHHAQLMSVLRDGVLKVQATEGGPAEEITVSGGFAEVDERGLTILAESVTA